jgi:hypothetical protein
MARSGNRGPLPYPVSPGRQRKRPSQTYRTIRKRIKTASEQRLLLAPEKCSEPLRRTLKGYDNCGLGTTRRLFERTRVIRRHLIV